MYTALCKYYGIVKAAIKNLKSRENNSDIKRHSKNSNVSCRKAIFLDWEF